MPRTQLIPLKNFTGGLNLRADPFTLGDTETPEMLNMDVDTRSGLKTRNPWRDWETVPEVGLWAPRSMYAHVKGDASETLFLTNDSDLWVRVAGGSFVQAAGTYAGDPHDGRRPHKGSCQP